MGDDEIPCLDFCGEGIDLKEENSEAWRDLSRKVREACETYGCFMLMYNNISMQLREEMMVGMKALFDLPQETKKNYSAPRHYSGYLGNLPGLPVYESFGIDDTTQLAAAQHFTNLMWPPHGNPAFCESLNSMSIQMQELEYIILKMIFESSGMGKYYESYKRETCSTFRLVKYGTLLPDHPLFGDVAKHEDSQVLGLPAHTDKNDLTILCQNDVQALQVRSKHGHWIQLMLPKGSFVVFVGDALKALSNGRLHAAEHRVMMSGDRERYTCGLFSLPKEGATIEVPPELVDHDHPLRYRPFSFSDYISFFQSNHTINALDVYAGVN